MSTHRTDALRRTTFWTLDRVADALAPLASGNLPRGIARSSAACGPTRARSKQGDLFVALVGERFDAHDFLARRGREGRGGRRRVACRARGGTRRSGLSRCATRSSRSARSARYRRRAWDRPGRRRRRHERKDEHEGAAPRGARQRARGARDDRQSEQPHRRSAHAARDPRRGGRRGVEMGTNQPGEIARLRAIVEPNVDGRHFDRRGASRGARRSRGRAARGARGRATVCRVAIVPARSRKSVDAARGARDARRRGGARRRRRARRRRGRSTPTGAAG